MNGVGQSGSFRRFKYLLFLVMVFSEFQYPFGMFFGSHPERFVSA